MPRLTINNLRFDALGIATLGFALALLSAGCTSLDPSPFNDWVKRDPATWRTPGAATSHHSATLQRDVGDPSESGDLPEVPGVEDYVRLALERNPGLLAAELNIERLSQRIAQAEALDDPMLSVSPVGEMAQTAAGEVGLMTSVSQKLPLPAKRHTRGRIAAQDVAMAGSDLAQRRIAVAAQTRQAYWSYYSATRAIEVIENQRRYVDAFGQIASARLRAGTVAQSDVLRASVEASTLQADLATQRQRQGTAVAMLNSLMDRPATSPLPPPPIVTHETVDLQLQPLLAQAAQQNPALAKLHQRIEQYRQQKKLADLNYWPDLTVGVTYNAVEAEGLARAPTGDDQWWVTFAINIPLWVEKRQAAQREALHGIGQGVAELADTRNQIAFRVEDAYLRTTTQQSLVAMFDSVILPQARQTVESATSGYRAGTTDFLSLVESWRRLVSVELMYHNAVAQMQRDYADLLQAIGRE